jgi:hypothetical protein
VELGRIFCPHCRLEQPAEHLYCPRCGTSLPTELLDPKSAKAVRFFAAIKIGEGDPEEAFLRVSSYRREQRIEAPEGSVVIPGHHVRFSVWMGDAALCALSLPESEARELGEFLVEELGRLDDPRPQAH